jgi:ABC-type polysaccharide/polyol phosphate transport system ATPase subunit
MDISKMNDNPVEDIAISIQNISKIYKRDSSLTALDNISLDISKGSVWGVIGPNGAGKSTLLKILSGVTRPTSGRIIINGKLASILDIGTGFHMDLTGKDNVILSCKILGFTLEEIEDAYDSIVEFSEIGSFLNTPVKYYSNGMYLRLAFSIITQMKTDIIVIDEIISVGDQAFREKCFQKISEMASSGRTVVVAGHNLEELERVADYGLWIQSGRLKMKGEIYEVVNGYLLDGIIEKTSGKKDSAHVNNEKSDMFESPYYCKDWSRFSLADQLNIIKPLEACVKNVNGERIETVISTEPFSVEFIFEAKKELKSAEIILTIASLSGIELVSSSYIFNENYRPTPVDMGLHKAVFSFPESMLHRGKYLVGFIISVNQHEFVSNLYPAFILNVQYENGFDLKPWHIKAPCVKFNSHSELIKISSSA